MAAERYALVVYLVNLRQAEYLEATESVSMGPAQPMKRCSRQVFHQFIARAQEEVIGVGENQLEIQLFEVARWHGFDRAGSADRGKNRSRDVAVRRVQYAGAGSAICRDNLEFE